jgi:hypothetical protein
VRHRVQFVLSVTALVVAVFGATPLGHAAGQLVAGVPPFAKTASYATFSGNSSKLNGRTSTLSGAPGTIPVVGKDGKLPASIGSVGPQGPHGPKGDKGANGASSVVVRVKNASSGSNQVTGSTSCLPGERAVGGGWSAGATGPPGGGPVGPLNVFYSKPVPATAGATPTGWEVSIYFPTAVSTTVTVYALCASP